jgi:hypothetical protein
MRFNLYLVAILISNYSFGGINFGGSVEDITDVVRQFSSSPDINSPKGQNMSGDGSSSIFERNSGTDEFWDSSSGEWRTKIVNPKTLGDSPYTSSYESEPTTTSSGDSDNDVPTLLRILSAVDNIDSDNDVPTLSSILSQLQTMDNKSILEDILEELKDEDNQSLPITDVDNAQNIADTSDKLNTDYSDQLPSEDLNPFSTKPSGSIPSFTFETPKIGGGSDTHEINFDDHRYQSIFSLLATCVTAVFTWYSIKFTVWNSSLILTS